MALPTQPITLTTAQIDDLSRHFSSFRHDVNGCLSLVVAATELIRYNPTVVKRMTATLIEQPPKIAGKVSEFVGECERVLTIRNAEPSWYQGLWRRSNVVAGGPTEPVTVDADHARALHGELLQLGKELTNLGFILSGVLALAARDGAAGGETMPSVSDQFGKAIAKYDQAVDKCEAVLKIEESGTRRLASGAPSGPVTLSPDQVMSFHGRLIKLQRDVHEHLGPLLELSRLARSNPEQLQTRSGEFSEPPPRISAVVTEFSNEFDHTFGILRATA